MRYHGARGSLGSVASSITDLEDKMDTLVDANDFILEKAVSTTHFCDSFNPLTAKLFYCNFHPLEFVSC